MRSDLLKLSKSMIAVLEMNGITTPTPVQKEIIPAVLAGSDVLAQSETGSGKTLSFAIPIIEKIERNDGFLALILVPTRELCGQITVEFEKFSEGKHLGIAAVYGGVSINTQIKKLRRVNIVVATPGRLLDILDRKLLSLSTVKYLVFDEADRMLDMGFMPDVERILRRIPQKKQIMMFSATVPKEITELSKKYLDHPKYVRLESDVKPELLHQTYYQTTQELRLALLISLLRRDRDLALVFCNRKHVTAKLAKSLSREGVAAKCLHGDMSQSQRERATSEFKNKKFSVLIATDVAARGLHIEDVTHVYNYEIPKDVDSYTHRVGRTARAGKRGEAISIVATPDDQKFFKQILFRYSGSIVLRKIDKDSLPEIQKPEPKPVRRNRPSGTPERQRDNRHPGRQSGGKREFSRSRDQAGRKKKPEARQSVAARPSGADIQDKLNLESKKEKKHKKSWREKWLDMLNM